MFAYFLRFFYRFEFIEICVRTRRTATPLNVHYFMLIMDWIELLE